MNIQILDSRLSGDKTPRPHTDGSAGIDLRIIPSDEQMKNHALPQGIWINPGEVMMFRTGIKAAIPEGHVGLIVPRSSTGIKGIHLANSTGVIDSDYRGEIMMPIKNDSDETLYLEPLERVAQLIIVPHYNYAGINFVDALDATERGEGGFGHTGRD